MTVYLDNNATTRPAPEVLAAMEYMLREAWHNPSSIHRPGQLARQKVELARQSVARLIGAAPREITFTSGAAESVCLAVRGVLAVSPPSRRAIVTTPIEHEAVRGLMEELSHHAPAGGGYNIRMLPVSRDGVADPGALPALLDDSVAIVTVQWANNETGAIQPVEAIGRVCRDRAIPFHSDATQAVGKVPINVAEAPVDLLSFSAHKFHGPKGVGALWHRRTVSFRPQVIGNQEKGRRGGTENTAGIVGMGIAAELAGQYLADPAAQARVLALRDRLEKALISGIPEASVNAAKAPRLSNTSNIAFPRLEADALLLLLSERGVCASAGAACASGSLDASPVLAAMGVPLDHAHGSVRFSVSRDTSDDEIDEALRVIPECVQRLRSSAPSLA